MHRTVSPKDDYSLLATSNLKATTGNHQPQALLEVKGSCLLRLKRATAGRWECGYKSALMKDLRLTYNSQLRTTYVFLPLLSMAALLCPLVAAGRFWR